MPRFFSVLVIALGLLPSVADAQEAPGLRPGTRVRVWTSPTADPVIGKVLKLDATTMTLSVEDVASPITVTRNSITRTDVRGGRHPTRRSILVGALVGAGIGVVTGLVAGDDDPYASLYLAPVGALFGMIVWPGEERWITTTSTSEKLSQTIGLPTPSFRVTFRF
jgi:hypothetical protein